MAKGRFYTLHFRLDFIIHWREQKLWTGQKHGKELRQWRLERKLFGGNFKSDLRKFRFSKILLRRGLHVPLSRHQCRIAQFVHQVKKDHRHLREIDRSSAIVGWQATAWAMALNPGANQYTGPAFSAKACFMVDGNITTSVNKARWAGPMSGLLN